MNKHALLLATFRSQRWAISPEWYAQIERILEERSAGVPLDAATRDAMRATSYGGEATTRPDKVALIQVYGPIVQRADLFSEVSALASHASIAANLRAAADDDSVREIVIDMDSPGGVVAGIDVSLEAMRYTAVKKPVTVVSEGTLASAAYWLGSQAQRLVVAPTAIVGSISIMGEHRDISEAQAQMGVKTTVLTTGPYKALGHSTQPLTDEAKDKLLAEMLVVHDLFVEAVAAGRNVTAEQAQARWADGSVWIGQQAVDNGLVDEIGTLQSVLDGMTQARAPRRGKGAKASMDLEQLKAEHPELYAQVVASAQAEERTKAQAQPAAGSDLEKAVVSLQAQLDQEREEKRTERRKNIASNALEAAALPKMGVVTGVDLDASFRAQVEGTALGAEDDAEAKTKVDALVAERRALLGVKGEERKPTRTAFLPSGDNSREETPRADVQPTVKGARRTLGLR